MKLKLPALILGGALVAGASGMAAARDNVHFSLSFGVPAYTYVAPPPVYYPAPALAYYPPVAPRVYYSSSYYGPAYYGPAWRGHGHGHYGHGHRGHGHGHHRGHHR